MDFSLFYRLKNDQSQLFTALLYVAVALAIAVIFCYGIFTVNIYLHNQKISQLDQKIAVYGSDEQKAAEKKALDYKKEISDFANIVANHKISAGLFSFIQDHTLPSVWFSSFSAFEDTDEINVSGETKDWETLSHQVNIFETNKEYIKNATMATAQFTDGRVKFILRLSLAPKIFTYGASPLPAPVASPIAVGNLPESALPFDILQSQPYSNTKEGFKISAPKGWKVDETGKRDPTVIFTNNQADIQGTSSFSATMSVASGLAGKLNLDTYVAGQKNALAKSLANYQLVENEQLTVDGLPAYLIGITYTEAPPSTTNVRMLQLIVIKNDNVYIVTGTALNSAWDTYKDLMRSSLLTLTLQ